MRRLHALARFAFAMTLVLVSPLRASDPPDEEIPIDKSLAYRTLQAEIRALEKDIATRQFGYYGQSERDRLKKDLLHLKQVQKRVDGYVFALPANCDEYQPLATGKQPSQNVVQMGPDESHVLLAPDRNHFGEKPINAYTARDVRCRPRMRISDAMLLKVREAEDLRRTLGARNFDFEHRDQKHEAEQHLADLELELRQAGVPGDIHAAPPRPEKADLQIMSGQPVHR
ncbi:MAG: hypothetical protein ABIJ09_06345 [Pseudomonadota bacterium]